MRVAIITTDYPAFLEHLYSSEPELQRAAYATQMDARYRSLFGVSDYYSYNLRALGHGALDFYINNEPMQRAWAAEKGLDIPPSTRRLEFRLRKGIVPWMSVSSDARWRELVARAQIDDFRPDVVLIQNMEAIRGPLIQWIAEQVPLVVGQSSFPTPHLSEADLASYSFVVSSCPPTLKWFQDRGIAAHLHRLGFDPRISEALHASQRTHAVTFVGSLLPLHHSRIRWLERICAEIPETRVWAPDVSWLPRSSAIRRAHQGTAWGRDMYRVLQESEITLNHHGDACPHANNMRLYEATGVGACLLTDRRPGLSELFDPGGEVAVFSDSESAVRVIKSLLGDTQQRRRISEAGQMRTQTSHTYFSRMGELVALISQYA